MSIFDESGASRDRTLFADVFVSLGRQWLVRSGLWKLASGAVVSALILGGWGFAFTQGVSRSLDRSLEVMAGNPIFFQPHTSLDEQEFEREAAQAVTILARMRKAEETKRASAERQNHQSNEQHPSQDTPATASNSPNKG